MKYLHVPHGLASKDFYPDTATLIEAIGRGELRLENEIILIKGRVSSVSMR